MSSRGKNTTSFDRLLLIESIGLRESLAICKYESMSESERLSISKLRPDLSDQFEALNEELAQPADRPCPSDTKCKAMLDGCRKAISMLVSKLGFANVRDPRHLMRTSSYRVVTKRIRHDDPDEGEVDEDSSV